MCLTPCHKIILRHLKSSPPECLFPLAVAKCLSHVIFYIKILKLPRVRADLWLVLLL